MFAAIYIRSASCFTPESGRDNSFRERKPGECCEQRKSYHVIVWYYMAKGRKIFREAYANLHFPLTQIL
jgi:hypothetical protein